MLICTVEKKSKEGNYTIGQKNKKIKINVKKENDEKIITKRHLNYNKIK
jgi:hypothetical protein